MTYRILFSQATIIAVIRSYCHRLTPNYTSILFSCRLVKQMGAQEGLIKRTILSYKQACVRGQLFWFPTKINEAIIAIQSGVVETALNWELGKLSSGFCYPASTSSDVTVVKSFYLSGLSILQENPYLILELIFEASRILLISSFDSLRDYVEEVVPLV